MLKCQLITQAKENLSLYAKTKGRTQCRELPLCAGSGKGCQWQALPSPVQCEETVTQTRDLPVTSGKTLPLALGPPFSICKNKIKKSRLYMFAGQVYYNLFWPRNYYVTASKANTLLSKISTSTIRIRREPIDLTDHVFTILLAYHISLLKSIKFFAML